MGPSDNHSSAPNSSLSHRQSIASFSSPNYSFCNSSSLFSAPSQSSFHHPLTPDPSPSMDPQDPKTAKLVALQDRDVPVPLSSSPGLKSKLGATLSTAPLSLAAPSLTPMPSLSAPSPLSSSSSPSSIGARPSHTLYSNATPPMSPSHTFLSPTSQPCHGSSDPNHYSTAFYQLPPPLQSPRAHDSSCRSPTMASQQFQHIVQNGGPVSLPPPKSSQPVGYSGVSPRSNPQQSPHMHPPLTSSSIGPLSPYPTPQHRPQHHSSPHQSPRYDANQHKQPVPPSMSLPASSLSSTSVFQAMPPRAYPGSYPAGQPIKSPASHGTHLKSPRISATQRSTPNSPQRFMMLPPQTAPTMASARLASAQAKSSSSNAATKRRSSSNAKAVDQETREIMRKVSHSAIERRRRERINDKILQLKHLVPACVDEDHLHKLSILQSTIEYVQYLKSVIPESVANAKFQKATNNNPNNKTTDMLDALGVSGSSTMFFAPMMTTGLGHPYSKRARTEQTLGPTCDLTAYSSRTDSPMLITGPEDRRRVTGVQSSSDEDAKDGLLLLSQISSGAVSVNVSPNLKSTQGANQEEPRYDNSEQGSRKRRFLEDEGEDEDEDEEEEEADEEEDEPFRDGPDETNELDDVDYQDDGTVEEDEIEDRDGGEAATRRSSSSKMSVDRLLVD
ncbi:hypothetical protein BC939DRAFT_471198 [Gamsiella multidivaricata]|uniref:uncharacterized protein n=1 Tax=Gamsiella multidivaricata TaxID=101098 RepID=UPI00221F11EB|nr:uncharacterized protein BC939DRAFT_471198 [Gamsiella multidivaricata]KAI7815860.1 hypothetical protein BC939DRAFT_471198 [Gamsiella multidivaricata]